MAPGSSGQIGPVMDPQDQGEGVGWQVSLGLVIMDTVGCCQGPVGANLGCKVIIQACCKVPTRVALHKDSMGVWSATRRRAIQGKEFSWERVWIRMEERSSPQPQLHR